MSNTNTALNRNDNQIDLYPSRIHDKPTITSRKDPVVYPDAGFTGPLSKEQLDFFERNGYLFLDSFFSEEETAGLKEELNKVWQESADRRVPEVIREPGGDEVRSVFAVHRDNEIFRELSRNSRIVGAVQQILGSEAYIHQSRINFKPGFTGKEFYWHSDFETWHVEDGMPRMRALSCSVALEDNYAYNGALMVVPGSHKHYISCVGRTPDENYKSSLRKQIYGVPDNDSLKWLVEQGGIEMPTGKAGSILLFDCNIMHGSNSNITPYPRSNVFMVYNSVENKLVAPYSGQKPRPDYIATRD
ncbi:ectoine hydroxylase [Chlamydia abortus]|uniref:Ectoine hydroxylase n=1 Tax=Paenibacillus residui TaxID=629724 RepID=A0ABW3D6U9_9BACL|nr:ectoine hydroxylase [Paenibacillus sp. 32O-W]SHE10903.1 ectoine hydroxylase [Chlamydia abortus]